MTGAWCVVPVKRLDRAKQRLAPALSRDERRELVLAMLADVLAAARGAGLGGMLIATPDREVAMLGRSQGAVVLADPREEAGLSASVEHAVRHLAGLAGVERAVVLAADLPFARADDIAALAAGPDDVTLVPDRWGTGTNAMALDPRAPMRFAFGTDSLARHKAAALAEGLSVSIAQFGSLAIDIDTPEDLLLLRESHGPGRAADCVRRLVHAEAVG